MVLEQCCRTLNVLSTMALADRMTVLVAKLWSAAFCCRAWHTLCTLHLAEVTCIAVLHVRSAWLPHVPFLPKFLPILFGQPAPCPHRSLKLHCTQPHTVANAGDSSLGLCSCYHLSSAPLYSGTRHLAAWGVHHSAVWAANCLCTWDRHWTWDALPFTVFYRQHLDWGLVARRGPA